MQTRRSWLVLVVVLIPSVCGAHNHKLDLAVGASGGQGSKLLGFHAAVALTLREKPPSAHGDATPSATGDATPTEEPYLNWSVVLDVSGAFDVSDNAAGSLALGRHHRYTSAFGFRYTFPGNKGVAAHFMVHGFQSENTVKGSARVESTKIAPGVGLSWDPIPMKGELTKITPGFRLQVDRFFPISGKANFRFGADFVLFLPHHH